MPHLVPTQEEFAAIPWTHREAAVERLLAIASEWSATTPRLARQLRQLHEQLEEPLRQIAAERYHDLQRIQLEQAREHPLTPDPPEVVARRISELLAEIYPPARKRK